MSNLAPQALSIHIAEQGGFDLHLTAVGHGAPTLVFMHYWGGSSRTWRFVIERLALRRRCLAYDHRGWGGSGAPPTGFAIADLARDTLAVTHALELGPYVLIGHSMGGKVAQAVAATHPPGLLGLVLVAPAPAAPAAVLDDAAQRQLLGAYANRDTVRFAIEHVLTHHLPGDEIIEQIVADSLSGTPAATATWPTAATNEDVSAGVGAIDVPTLVIAGRHDHVEPLTLLADHVVPSIPSARLEVVEDSGHLIPLEQPRELAALIETFVDSL